MKQGLLVVAQIGLLMAISELGYALVAWSHIPLPGNVLGMVLLFVLLASGIVRLQWIEAGASLLLKHLAFFFVAIAVGLMSLGEVLRASGWVLLAVLLASAAVGIVLAGGVTQWFSRKGKARRDSVAEAKWEAP
jgi:holin-like protein